MGFVSGFVKNIALATTEFVATTAFLLLSLGAIMAQPPPMEQTLGNAVFIAAAFATSAFAVASIFTPGHLNPAISTALLVADSARCSVVEWLLLVPAQLCAGLLAGFVLRLLAPASTHRVTAVNYRHSNLSVLSTFFLELTATAMLTFIAVAPDNKNGALTCMTVFVLHCFLVNYTGCGVNPARSLAGAVCGSNFDDLWIYIFAPMLGGIMGGVSARYCARFEKWIQAPFILHQ